MKENKKQKEFRLAMNDLLSTDTNKKHTFETKNDYKDYPCECGATNNLFGSTCQRYKITRMKNNFYDFLTPTRNNKQEWVIK